MKRTNKFFCIQNILIKQIVEFLKVLMCIRWKDEAFFFVILTLAFYKNEE